MNRQAAQPRSVLVRAAAKAAFACVVVAAMTRLADARGRDAGAATPSTSVKSEPSAAATPGAAGATATTTPAATAGGGDIGGCVESLPKGGQKPLVSEAFPLHGTSGWAATLSITVRHGRGERVLPSGLDLSAAVEAKKYLQKAGFAIPDQDGGAAAYLWTEPEDKERSLSITHLELPLVVLPPQPGRSTMELPPLPVAVARANGEVATVCTHPHTITVEDPIANVPQAEPKANPPPRPQREEWTALKRALLWGSLGLLVGALLAYFGYKQLTKPKPPVPPPPPRPPWEIALEKLDEIRHAGLLDARRHAEYFDRVSDAVRGYLGARFGFDGLESTSDEIVNALKKHGAGFVRSDDMPAAVGAPVGAGVPASVGAPVEVGMTPGLGATASASSSGGAAARAGFGAPSGPSPGVPLDDIRRFLGECDLVKFANLRPSPEGCAAALASGEFIVRTTMPFYNARSSRGSLAAVGGGAMSAAAPSNPAHAAGPSNPADSSDPPRSAS